MAIASILICTRDRAGNLEKTLTALAGVCVPDGMTAELIVVDNGSTDNTAETVRAFAASRACLPTRYLCEPRPGKSHAYNAGLAAARAAGAELLLFTDDDVRPPRDWLPAMCAPIVSGAADAVAGGIRIASHLQRPWMEPQHHAYLASTEHLDTHVPPPFLIGANMAFSTRVLERVPAFDTELGPGRLGFSEEVLFSYQLTAAGFRLAAAFGNDATVEHHFDPSRLRRDSFLRRATDEGRSQGYIAHHWGHWATRFGPHHLLRAALRLWLWRVRHPGPRRGDQEGCPVAEMLLVQDVAFCRQILHEQKRPRCYAMHGLVKRCSEG